VDLGRNVRGGSTQATMTAQLVTDALLMDVWRRGTPSSELAHSDQGGQCRWKSFQRVLVAQGIVCNLSVAGNLWDNDVVNSFFLTLKTQRTVRKQYATGDAARADVFAPLERFSNPIRRHSSVGYRSSREFEQAVA